MAAGAGSSNIRDVVEDDDEDDSHSGYIASRVPGVPPMPPPDSKAFFMWTIKYPMVLYATDEQLDRVDRHRNKKPLEQFIQHLLPVVNDDEENDKRRPPQRRDDDDDGPVLVVPRHYTPLFVGWWEHVTEDPPRSPDRDRLLEELVELVTQVKVPVDAANEPLLAHLVAAIPQWVGSIQTAIACTPKDHLDLLNTDYYDNTEPDQLHVWQLHDVSSLGHVLERFLRFVCRVERRSELFGHHLKRAAIGASDFAAAEAEAEADEGRGDGSSSTCATSTITALLLAALYDGFGMECDQFPPRPYFEPVVMRFLLALCCRTTTTTIVPSSNDDDDNTSSHPRSSTPSRSHRTVVHLLPTEHVIDIVTTCLALLKCGVCVHNYQMETMGIGINVVPAEDGKKKLIPPTVLVRSARDSMVFQRMGRIVEEMQTLQKSLATRNRTAFDY